MTSVLLGFEPTTLDMLPRKIPRGRRVLGYQNDAQLVSVIDELSFNVSKINIIIGPLTISTN